MSKIRGFKIRRKFCRISKWLFRRGPFRYNRLAQPNPSPGKPKPITKLINWGRRHLLPAENSVKVPKGHLAIYVGNKEGGDLHRVLVPVIYINHPLFSGLLRDAEEEFGFNQQGGITLPCCFSEFERVQTRIMSSGSGWTMTWKRHKHMPL